MNKIIGAVLYSLLATFNLTGQTNPSPNIVGTTHQITSKILNEDRTIQIYLPPDYEESDKTYPVLYVLDGQRFFLYAVSLAQSYKQFAFTPDFIIVGITNSYPQRFQLFSDRKDEFLSFFEEELIPYVDSSYRTHQENLLFGWEFGAGFGFHAMVNKPSLFNGYFLASPYPIIDQISALDSVSSLPVTLCYAVSPDEYEINQALDKLDSLLPAKGISDLNWHSYKLPLEEHRSTSFPTLNFGLREYFYYYPELEINNAQKFMNMGGMDYANTYIKERESRYGFPPELSIWSRYTIVRSAIRAERFDYFESLLESLDTNDTFIQELIDGGRGYGASDIAGFYEKNNKYPEAIAVYEILLKNYPDSERLLTRMGNAQKSAGNVKAAKSYFDKAQEISKSGK